MAVAPTFIGMGTWGKISEAADALSGTSQAGTITAPSNMYALNFLAMFMKATLSIS